jgi:hypothetical protein
MKCLVDFLTINLISLLFGEKQDIFLCPVLKQVYKNR